ncbi:MAG: phage baseplate protein, partial [Lactobacillus sp.]|nr:phage baseplate protein [Lactobacillus sp.]MDN6779904.1 phage baseplate protein [Lactobacillus sp.]MDN6809805.1 phage baseplate protein [Lentilactobacillus parabuchneri]
MTSNEKSFPWDDHNGDREYSSDEFAEFFSTLFKPGVVATANFGTGLQITESASLGMRVKFGSGEAFSSFGRNYVHDKDEEVTVPIASTLQDRTDSVAIQFNKS